jgi:imidazolonepropionase-like amidohydrolase
MATMIDISHEFGVHIAAFHHTSEGYKIAPLLAKENICMLTWADWAGFKMESLDGIEANAALAHRAGACVIIHSDDPIITQHLNQEAGIAMMAGNRIGLNITPAEAIAWITLNPAKAAGVDARTGSLEPGKMADVVIWSANPFSIYAKADKVFVDGGLAFDRKDPRFQPKSDFELGQPGEGAFQ